MRHQQPTRKQWYVLTTDLRGWGWGVRKNADQSTLNMAWPSGFCPSHSATRASNVLITSWCFTRHSTTPAGSGTARIRTTHVQSGVNISTRPSSKTSWSFSNSLSRALVKRVFWSWMASLTRSTLGRGMIVSRKGTIGLETFTSTLAYLKKQRQHRKHQKQSYGNITNTRSKHINC